MVAKAVTSWGHSLMRVLSRSSFRDVKAEVDDMTDEEARDLWSHLEPFFPRVCARASSRRRDAAWLELVRKMQLFKQRAEGGG